MRKPVNNETRLINEIWNNTNKHLNEQATGPQIQYDIDSLDLSEYTPQEQAEIRKQLKAQNFSNLTKFIAKPESGKYVLGEPNEPIEPAPSIRYRPGPYDVDQKGLQKALRYNKNVVVDSKGKKNYVSDMAKATGWEPPVETPEPTVSKIEQPKAGEKYRKMMPGANWAELTANALDRAKKFVGPPKPSDEERADVMGTFEYPDSIFDPNTEKKTKEAAQAKYRKMIPGANWAELTADELKKQKIKTIQAKPVTAKEAGPEVDIEDTDGVVEVDMRQTSEEKPEKSVPEFPRWSESPHGYEPVTPEQAEKTAQTREAENKFIDKTMYPFGFVQKTAATKVGPPVPTQAERNQQAIDAAQKMADSVTSAFKPKSTNEVTPVNRYKKQLADRVSPSVVKTSEIESMFNFTPQSPGDMGPKLDISTGKPLETKAETVQSGIEKTLKRAEKLAGEEKAATPEQQQTVQKHAEMLSKETGKPVTPYTVAHEKATQESIRQRLKETEPVRTTTPKPEVSKQSQTQKTTNGGPGSGRDTSNIVPGSQMWGELSVEEKRAVRDRYAKGEGPSISVRYNKETGKFDEPGYGDQGQYGDIVKALNMNESVDGYCKFISEMAKSRSKSSKEPILPGLPATNKLEKSTPKAEPKAEPKPKTESKPKAEPKPKVEPKVETKSVSPKPTEEPSLFSAVPDTKPTVEEKPKSRRTKATPKSEPKIETKPEPVSTPVTPTPTPTPKPTPTTTTTTKPLTPGLVKAPNWTWGSGVVAPQMKQAEPPMMSRTKAAGLGAAAGAAGAGLLATILAITSRGHQQTPTSAPESQTQMAQPKPMNTENTPSFSAPQKTPAEKSRLFKL